MEKRVRIKGQNISITFNLFNVCDFVCFEDKLSDIRTFNEKNMGLEHLKKKNRKCKNLA